MKRLNNHHLPNEGVTIPRYSRVETGIGIVHLGIGAFHRAHQGFYTEKVLEQNGGNWGICGVSLRRSEVRDQMDPQDCLYSLMEQDGEGNRIRVIGAVKEVLFAPKDHETVLSKMSSPQTRVVSLTVTEKGYCHDLASGRLNFQHPDIIHDLESPFQPISAIGFLVQALSLRKKSGVKAFTVMSCDNLPENGKTLKNLVVEFAKRRNQELAEWIENESAFPCSMVDRIVPATTEADRKMVSEILGYRDNAVVVTEPFSQWVIEDDFVNGRPAWENSGAQMVGDVKPFEEMKLRMLNGTHSTLAYLGCLGGIEYVSEAVLQTDFENFLRKMMMEEIIPTLKLSESVNLDQYQNELIKRYQNPALKHRLWQIAMDGSQKLPQRLLNTIRDRLNSGCSFPRLALAVAGWMRFVVGKDEHGITIEIRDPLADELKQIAQKNGVLAEKTTDFTNAEIYVSKLLSLSEVFGTDLPRNSDFCDAVNNAFKMLLNNGVLNSIHELS
jgi:fructuronate reductase